MNYLPTNRKLMGFWVAGLGLILLTLGYAVSPANAELVQEFKGKIAKSYEESQEWWPEPVRPPKGLPNVIIFLLDDVGFAQVDSFGGHIETPNIDRLAENGLPYNNFHKLSYDRPLLSLSRHTDGRPLSALYRIRQPRGYRHGIPWVQRHGPSVRQIGRQLPSRSWLYHLRAWQVGSHAVV